MFVGEHFLLQKFCCCCCAVSSSAGSGSTFKPLGASLSAILVSPPPAPVQQYVSTAKMGKGSAAVQVSNVGMPRALLFSGPVEAHRFSTTPSEYFSHAHSDVCSGYRANSQ